MGKSQATLLAAGIVLAFSLCALSLHPQSKPEVIISSAVPDIIGIRPGMSAQEAYNLLKARHAGIKIGVGQFQIAGLGDKPIPTQIAAQVEDASEPEIFTVWLTTPPGPQVVFAVGRLLEYDQNSPLLRKEVLASLRKKYGPETDSNPVQ